MTAPLPTMTTEEKVLFEERCCDKIAEIWVRFLGDLQMFRARFDELVGLFDEDVSREGRLDLCCIIDQWDDAWGLTGGDFVCLRGEIEGWIVAHMAACGMNNISI